MRVITIAMLLVAMCVLSCSKHEEPSIEALQKAELLEAAAASQDSLKNLHEGFRGTHQHLNTAGNLSVHAHQDLPQKRRLAKRRAELAPVRRAAYKKSQEREKERVAEYFRKKRERERADSVAAAQ